MESKISKLNFYVPQLDLWSHLTEPPQIELGFEFSTRLDRSQGEHTKLHGKNFLEYGRITVETFT